MTVLGSHGLYQIDDSTFCLSVMDSGNLSGLTPSYSDPEAGINTYTITSTANTPLFGLYIPSSTGFYGTIVRTTLSGSTWTVKIALTYPINGSGSFNLADVKWFAFARPTPTTGTYGLEVYDANGAMKFSSMWKTKTIAGVEGTTIDTNKKYAVVGGTFTYNRNLNVELLTDFTWYYSLTIYAGGYQSTNGGVFYSDFLVYEEQGPGTGGGSSGSVNYGTTQPGFAVDVTEYV